MLKRHPTEQGRQADRQWDSFKLKGKANSKMIVYKIISSQGPLVAVLDLLIVSHCLHQQRQLPSCDGIVDLQIFICLNTLRTFHTCKCKFKVFTTLCPTCQQSCYSIKGIKGVWLLELCCKSKEKLGLIWPFYVWFWSYINMSVIISSLGDINLKMPYGVFL